MKIWEQMVAAYWVLILVATMILVTLQQGGVFPYKFSFWIALMPIWLSGVTMIAYWITFALLFCLRKLFGFVFKKI